MRSMLHLPAGRNPAQQVAYGDGLDALIAMPQLIPTKTCTVSSALRRMRMRSCATDAQAPRGAQTLEQPGVHSRTSTAQTGRSPLYSRTAPEAHGVNTVREPPQQEHSRSSVTGANTTAALHSA